MPIHGAGEHEPGRDLGATAGREVHRVNAGRDRGDARATRQIAEGSTVLLRDGDRQVDAVTGGSLAASQLSPFDFEQRFAGDMPLECREAAPDQVFDVVLEQHDWNASAAWQIRHGNQEIGHTEVDGLLVEELPDLFTHRSVPPLPEIDRIWREP